MTVIQALPVQAKDQNRSDWFKSLTQPSSNESCCDISDCHKTSAKWESGGWWAEVRGRWRAVPQGVVLVRPYSIDGDAYVCSGDPANDEGHHIDPVIFCFVPPDAGS